MKHRSITQIEVAKITEIKREEIGIKDFHNNSLMKKAKLRLLKKRCIEEKY